MESTQNGLTGTNNYGHSGVTAPDANGDAPPGCGGRKPAPSRTGRTPERPNPRPTQWRPTDQGWPASNSVPLLRPRCPRSDDRSDWWFAKWKSPPPPFHSPAADNSCSSFVRCRLWKTTARNQRVKAASPLGEGRLGRGHAAGLRASVRRG